MIVVLAEKPPQARDYAKSFGSYKSKTGYIEVVNDKGEQIYITWAIGHLLEIPKPAYFDEKYANWDLSHLPIFPDIKFLVKKGHEDHYKVVYELLNKATTVIVGTDADREGENIAWSILETVPNYKNKTIKRLWINSLEAHVIQEGFKNLQDGEKYYSRFLEARSRQVSDYLIGMNHSPLFTLLLQKKGVNKTFSIGRVQSPVLFMVYERELAIRNFVESKFYTPRLKLCKNGQTFEITSTKKFDTPEYFREYFHKYVNKVFKNTISDVTLKEAKESAPKLFSLSTLQIHLNKHGDFNPSEVLETVQTLYEGKYVTYPRTASNHITMAEYEYLKKSFNGYCDFLKVDLGVDIDTHTPKKSYVDGEKVVEHFAIVPTSKVMTHVEFEKLSDKEKIVYREILMRTLLTFMPPHVYKKTTVTVVIEDVEFSLVGKEIIDQSWKAFVKESKDVILPSFERGELIDMELMMHEGKVQSPKRLTEGNLITMMKYANKRLTDDEIETLESADEPITSKFQLATDATRHTIISKLKEMDYVVLKSKKIHLTPKGEILCKAIEGTLLASPEMTAKWEAFLEKIASGERTSEQFIDGIKTFVEKLINEAPALIDKQITQEAVQAVLHEETFGLCPLCKNGKIKHVRSKEYDFYACSEKGCKQTFSSNYLSKKITEAQLKKLLSKGQTDVIKGFKGKAEKPFDAYLTLEMKGDKFIYKPNFKKK